MHSQSFQNRKLLRENLRDEWVEIPSLLWYETNNLIHTNWMFIRLQQTTRLSSSLIAQ